MIRKIIKKALDEVIEKYEYDYAEDSTRVLTIKSKDRKNKRIIHSCDFAIVYNCDDGKQQYIRYNKKNNQYVWEYQPAGFRLLPDKIEWLKRKGLWNELRNRYIDKKNSNTNQRKHSRSILAEAIHEVCQQNGYYQ